MIPTRLACDLSPVLLVVDNVLITVTMIFTTVHYLYYCRVIRFVGPFVLMVYTIIATDIFRFMLIYGIFLMGFSQSFSLIFLSCEREANVIKKLITDQSEASEGSDNKFNLTRQISAYDTAVRSFFETLLINELYFYIFHFYFEFFRL